jgi:hypothetical protein
LVGHCFKFDTPAALSTLVFLDIVVTRSVESFEGKHTTRAVGEYTKGIDFQNVVACASLCCLHLLAAVFKARAAIEFENNLATR